MLSKIGIEATNMQGARRESARVGAQLHAITVSGPAHDMTPRHYYPEHLSTISIKIVTERVPLITNAQANQSTSQSHHCHHAWRTTGSPRMRATHTTLQRHRRTPVAAQRR